MGAAMRFHGRASQAANRQMLARSQTAIVMHFLQEIFMKKSVMTVLLILAFWCMCGFAQDETPKYTFNIGGGPGWPQGDVGNFTNVSGHFVIGGGANLGHTFGVDGEFMWHDLPPKDSIVALTGAPDGAARLYSVTGNIIGHTHETHKLGGYGIGGIGWYHRSWELTRPAISVGTVCLPSYLWWGVVCTNGLVQSTAELRSGSSDAFGWNVGAGVTYRLGESHGKFYTELRYHHAYTNKIDTQVLPLTFGFRW